MQSLPFIISADQKVEYISLLLKAGFDTVEVGSMASAKFVPQMADTTEVLRKLDLKGKRSKVMVLVMNRRGAEETASMEAVDCISFPWSISPVFLKKNLNATSEQSLEDVKTIVNLCNLTGKTPVIYISMAFGNPYGDKWSLDLLMKQIGLLAEAGVKVIPLSNVSVPVGEKMIADVFSAVEKEFPSIESGLHLHTDGTDTERMITAAAQHGCQRFDTVIHGIGGCPMSGGKMLGNLDTSDLLSWLEKNNIESSIDKDVFVRAGALAEKIFAHGA